MCVCVCHHVANLRQYFLYILCVLCALRISVAPQSPALEDAQVESTKMEMNHISVGVRLREIDSTAETRITLAKNVTTTIVHVRLKEKMPHSFSGRHSETAWSWRIRREIEERWPIGENYHSDEIILTVRYR